MLPSLLVAFSSLIAGWIHQRPCCARWFEIPQRQHISLNYFSELVISDFLRLLTQIFFYHHGHETL